MSTSVTKGPVEPYAFGRERIPHLLNDIRFMMRCMRNRESGLLAFITRKYFDAKMPSNLTVRLGALGGDGPADAPLEIHAGQGSWRAVVDESSFFDRLVHTVEGDFADFIGVQCLIDRRKPSTLKPLIDHLMLSFGEALEWDLSCPEYESYEGALTEEQKKKTRDELQRTVMGHVRTCALWKPSGEGSSPTNSPPKATAGLIPDG